MVSEWSDFQSYRSKVENAYRLAYKEYREAVEQEIQLLEQSTKSRPEFHSLSQEKQEVIISKWFGTQGQARAGISQDPIATLKELMDADQATSLDALAGRVGTIPGLLADIILDIQKLSEPPEGEEPGKDPELPKVRPWQPKSIAKGMIIRKEDAVDIAEKFKEELEEQFVENVKEIIVQ